MAKKTTKKTNPEMDEFETETPENYDEIETHETYDEIDENSGVNDVHDEEIIDDGEDEEIVDDGEDKVIVDDEEDEEPLVMNGTVTTRLNIRENDTGSPETPIVAVVEAGEEISVYPEEGNSTFFKVKTKNGVEGYAMRRYIILDAE